MNRFSCGLAICFIAAVAHAQMAQNSQLDVRNYGARCNWNTATNSGTDDTGAFSAASSAANIIYLRTGAPVSVLVPYGCEIAGSVVQKSGTHFVGPGSVYVPVNSETPPFVSNMADDVAVKELDMVAVTNSSACSAKSNNDLCAAIAWQTSNSGSNVQHKNVVFTGNHIYNFGWGILVLAADGSDSVTDVDIEGNSVVSSSPYSYADGIHVGGSISGFRIRNNYVYGRYDSAISATSEVGGHVCSGGTISGNVLLEDLIGIDDSGCQNLTITGNNATATTPVTNTSNPAFRSIFYGGVTPQQVNVNGNTFINYVDPSDDHASKFDNGGGGATPFNSSFTDNLTSFLYMRGSNISAANNTLLSANGGIYLDYDGANGIPSERLLIGTNNWLNGGTLTAGANPAYFINNHLLVQLTAGTITYVNVGNFAPGAMQ